MELPAFGSVKRWEISRRRPPVVVTERPAMFLPDRLCVVHSRFRLLVMNLRCPFEIIALRLGFAHVDFGRDVVAVHGMRTANVQGH